MKRRLASIVAMILLVVMTFALTPIRAFAELDSVEEVAAEQVADSADESAAPASEPVDVPAQDAQLETDSPEAPATSDEDQVSLPPVDITGGELASGEVGPIRYEAPNPNTAANYEANARGFYAWLGDDYANAFFTKTTTSIYDGRTFASFTNMGAADDATSLNNMREALELIPKGNQLRTTDDLFPGRAALKISSGAMAVAQVHANWSRNYFEHADYAGDNSPYGENLAWNYGSDPYRQWYDKEKIIYIETGVEDGSTGHYLNIVRSSFAGTGFAVSQGGDFGYPYTYAQTFSSYRSGDRLWDYDEYLSLFNTFYNAHDISKATVTFATQTYDGSAKTPVPTVKLGSTTLVNGTDYTLSNYKNNVNAGTASVTITAKGSKYFGSQTVTFTINARPINDAGASISSETYTGSSIQAKPYLTIGSKALVENTDYTITSYANNVNAGDATVTVTGKGNYRGTATFGFRINPANVSSAAITVADQTYDGKAKKPTPTVKVGGRTLVSGTDFTTGSYANNTDAGTASFTITGKGNYTGKASGTFKIKPADVSKATVAAANQTYNGSAKKPAPTVELGGKTLASGTDYSVSYADNTNAGTATVTVTGKGNYAGKASGTFKIDPASLAKATVTAANQTYTGSARKPAPTVELGGKTLASADYDVAYADNVNAGTATVTVTGKGNYKGTASGAFAVAQRAISAASIADIADQPYVGSAVKPKPALAYGGKALKEGTDYTLSYKANTAVGTATVTVAGKGNFKGTASKTFEIVKADLSKATVAPIADQTYSGSAKKPAPKASFGSLELKEGTDYTVAYSKNTDAGTATVTLTGKGNFTGKKTATFKIKPASIAKAAVAAKDQTYSGSALKPAPTVTLSGKTLAPADYDVSYANNVNAGTATVTVTGKGNYSGTASGAFKVDPASIAKAAVTAPDQEWTGKPVAPAPAVKLGSRTLKAGTDYKVTSYSDNVDAGTAKVTVQGKGNYKGTATGTFEIVDAVPVYRLYNRKTSEHLYTLNKNEYDQLPKITKGDWVQEGIAWYAPKTSKTPVYRLYNKRSGDHHYTTDQHERDTLVAKHGWTSEGVAFYSDDAKRLPLYRVYNSRLQRGQHHYTADANERKALTTSYGWVDEGVGFYGVRAK